MNLKIQNNFDLIRLFAATQVAITHTASHLGIESRFLDALELFPGVPIFFFVSGYLIYGSYAHSIKGAHPNINFFIKRFLRLYPALWLCFGLSLLSVWQSGYFGTVSVSFRDFAPWALAQATFFQFFNPDFMRGYGVGTLNGSLWTISVELQFYFLTPLLFILINKVNIRVIAALFLMLVCVNVLNAHMNSGEKIYQKLFNASFAPWLYMFVFGAMAYKFSGVIEFIKKINFFIILSAYIASYFITKNLGWGNDINPIAYFLLVMLVIKSAYTLPTLSDRVLKRNDISYGIYIFHMPIVNYLLYKGIMGLTGFLLGLFLTFSIALCSWFLFEKRVLSLKNNALRKV